MTDRGHNLDTARHRSALTRAANRDAAERVFIDTLADAETGSPDGDVARAAEAAGRSFAWGTQLLVRLKAGLGWQAQQRGQAWVLEAYRKGEL